jgi:hypothetical protein
MKNKRKHIKVGIKRSSTIFSSKEDAILLDSAKIASSKAVRSSIALGLTIKVIRDHQIIAINPDRSTKVLRNISKPTIDISSLRKGMILERK